MALLGLYKKKKEQILLKKAVLAGKQLLSKTIKMEVGIGWHTLYDRCLCGMSHGVAGIAYSLLSLAKITNDPAFKTAAEEAVQYERSLYSSENENWPDLRKGMEKGNPFSWCHGAPGIGLARIYSNQLYPDKKNEIEMDRALKTTQKHLTGALDHICCGNFGRISILWDAGILLGMDELKEMALKETSIILKRYHEKGTFHLFHKLPEEIQSPCFMQGLSGIGYFLLRLTKEGRNLPEILIFES